MNFYMGFFIVPVLLFRLFISDLGVSSSLATLPSASLNECTKLAVLSALLICSKAIANLVLEGFFLAVAGVVFEPYGKTPPGNLISYLSPLYLPCFTVATGLSPEPPLNPFVLPVLAISRTNVPPVLATLIPLTWTLSGGLSAFSASFLRTVAKGC